MSGARLPAADLRAPAGAARGLQEALAVGAGAADTKAVWPVAVSVTAAISALMAIISKAGGVKPAMTEAMPPEAPLTEAVAAELAALVSNLLFGDAPVRCGWGCASSSCVDRG